ncbi:MAG TPA: hypothetical protein VFQ44_06140 [Streptosporangiaceae bacterium]|nr:hypothetical protein [Streptosporangiaceae bacterium]
MTVRQTPHESAAASPDEIAKFVAEAAANAPSVSSTAPWWFSTTDTEICVRADVERKLAVADPAGRELTISCGAAVFTARIAVRYLGLLPSVRVLPDADVPNLIAKISWDGERKEPGDHERALFEQIPLLHRDLGGRGGFDGARLPAGLMSRLSEETARERATLRVMAADDHRAALLAVMAAADSAFRLDAALAGEGATWAVPGTPDFGLEPSSAGIVAVLTTAADQRADWVQAGQALQRLLLVAGGQGVEAAISARPFEFGQLREFIAVHLVGGEVPQLVLRFGMTTHERGG